MQKIDLKRVIVGTLVGAGIGFGFLGGSIWFESFRPLDIPRNVAVRKSISESAPEPEDTDQTLSPDGTTMAFIRCDYFCHEQRSAEFNIREFGASFTPESFIYKDEIWVSKNNKEELIVRGGDISELPFAGTERFPFKEIGYFRDLTF